MQFIIHQFYLNKTIKIFSPYPVLKKSNIYIYIHTVQRPKIKY